jgi:hypothetical protein
MGLFKGYFFYWAILIRIIVAAGCIILLYKLNDEPGGVINGSTSYVILIGFAVYHLWKAWKIYQDKENFDNL